MKKLHPKEPVSRYIYRFLERNQDAVLTTLLVIFTTACMVYGLHLALLDLTR